MAEHDRYRIGGLMRCCTELAIPAAPPGKEGDIITCPHCTDQIQFMDGAWEWPGRRNARTFGAAS